MERLIFQQEITSDEISRLFDDKLRSLVEPLNQTHIEASLKDLESKWELFQIRDHEIEMKASGGDLLELPYFADDLHGKTRDYYIQQKDEILKYLRVFHRTPTPEIAPEITPESTSRQIVSYYIKKLFDLPALTSESSVELQTLLTDTTSIIDALREQNRPVSDWDDMIVHLTVQKLNEQCRRRWDLCIAQKNDPVTFSELREFLEKQISNLAILERMTREETGEGN